MNYIKGIRLRGEYDPGQYPFHIPAVRIYIVSWGTLPENVCPNCFFC